MLITALESRRGPFNEDSITLIRNVIFVSDKIKMSLEAV